MAMLAFFAWAIALAPSRRAVGIASIVPGTAIVIAVALYLVNWLGTGMSALVVGIAAVLQVYLVYHALRFAKSDYNVG